MNTLARFSRILPERAVRSLILRGNLLRRAVTLGVRISVEAPGGRVLLVRHTYLPGWHLPGGGVDPGESAEAAACRELREECGVTARTRPSLFALYRNAAAAGRDHVALFRLPVPSELTVSSDDREIAAVGFFPRHDLPDGTSRATRARLAEMLDGAPLSETW